MNMTKSKTWQEQFDENFGDLHEVRVGIPYENNYSDKSVKQDSPLINPTNKFVRYIGRDVEEEIKRFIASQIEKTRREAKDVILHEINAKIDNITDAPSKPSDYKAWQKGFANAFEQVERIIKSCMKDIKNCEFCLDTGFMLCNGKNEPCVWCEKRRIKDKALGHGIEFGKHEGYEDGFKAGLQKAIELVPEMEDKEYIETEPGILSPVDRRGWNNCVQQTIDNLKKELNK